MTRDEIAHIMQDTSGAHWGDEAHFQRFAERLLKAEQDRCCRISDDPIYIASDGGFYPMPRQSKPEQRCEYIRSSGTTHWCALAEAGPKEKNHA